MSVEKYNELAELHSSIFIALKRPVVAGRFWPSTDDQPTSIVKQYKIVSLLVIIAGIKTGNNAKNVHLPAK